MFYRCRDRCLSTIGRQSMPCKSCCIKVKWCNKKNFDKPQKQNKWIFIGKSVGPITERNHLHASKRLSPAANRLFRLATSIARDFVVSIWIQNEFVFDFIWRENFTLHLNTEIDGFWRWTAVRRNFTPHTHTHIHTARMLVYVFGSSRFDSITKIEQNVRNYSILFRFCFFVL